MEVTLIPYQNNEEEFTAELIDQYTRIRGHADPDPVQARKDARNTLKMWRGKDNSLYLIRQDEEIVGFVFFSCNPYVPSCYVEIFVLPEKQEAGVLARVNELAEDAVQEYFRTLRPEADAEITKSVRLYQESVYTCKEPEKVQEKYILRR